MEGISLAIYEAMSMGVTVVSSLVGGQAELVVDGTGFLVRPAVLQKCKNIYYLLFSY